MEDRQPSRRGRWLRISAGLMMALLSFGQVAVVGQTDQARVTGVVRDQGKSVVQGATVTVRNERTGEQRIVNTNEDGTYMVTNLRPSSYAIRVGAQGFAESELTGIQLLVGQTVNNDFEIKPAGTAESVTIVAAEEAGLERTSAAIGANVNPREVAALPLNGRQVSQLYLQAPGSVNSGSGTFGDIRFSGRAVEQNILRYDGVEGTAIIDASPGNLNGEVPSPFRLQSSLENVQEFRVDSNSFPAEEGSGTGGQISLVTKSGGNFFHGAAFEYLRNSSLDAANFFDNIVGQKSPLRLNQFGASVGGPIARNRAFFFFSYEGYRLRAGVNSVEAVPGAQSRICAPAPNGVPCVESSGQASRTLSLLPAFADPRAVIVATGTGANLFDVAQLQDSAAVNENAYAARLDFKLTDKHNMYGRYFRDSGKNNQPEGVSGRRLNFTAIPQNAVLALTSLVSQRLLNEVKFGYNGAYTRTNGIARSVPGVDLTAAAINISGNTANFAIAGQGTSAGTSSPGGLIRANSATNGRGQPYTAWSLSIIDNVTYTINSHSFKIGFEGRANRMYTDRQGGTTFVFNNLTDFLANRAASVQFLGDVSEPSPFNNGFTGNRLAKSEYYFGFAQDEWKLRPDLTLNAGLRYEYYRPLYEDNNAQVFFDTVAGTILPSTKDNNPLKGNKDSFGPRISMAWSPGLGRTSGWFGGGKTVLRGGFGIYYGVGQVEDQIQPIESDRISSTISNSSFDPNIAGITQVIRQNFVSNPNNRVYQPRAYQPEYRIPEKVYSYTFSVQQELPYKLIGTVAYVGSEGRNLFLRGLSNTLRAGAATIRDGNPLPSAGVVNRTDANGRVIGVTSVRVFDVINNPAACGLSATAVPICRPFAEIDTKTSGGSDNYRALQVSLSRRLGTGLTLNSQYTFSRSFGNTSGSNEARTAANPLGGNNPGTKADVNDYAADEGYNNFDVRHTFNISAIYALPFGKGKAHDFGRAGNAILGNWDVGTIINARSGVPIDITVTRAEVVIQCTDPSKGCKAGEVRALPGTINAANPLPAGFTAVVNAPGGGASRQTRRPDLIPGVNPYLGNDRNFLNPAAFAIPQPGTFGNLPRNFLKGPNFIQFDLIFAKKFPIREAVNLEFRTEIFNVFNRTNFANPASTLNNALGVATGQLQPGQPFTQSAAGATFGLLRQTVERTVGLGTSRQIQFAMRLNF